MRRLAAMRRQTIAPAARAMAARWFPLCARKLPEGAAVADAFITASDSEAELAVLAKAAVDVLGASDFGRIGSALATVAGSEVLAGTALVLETVMAGTAWDVMFGIPFEQTKVWSGMVLLDEESWKETTFSGGVIAWGCPKKRFPAPRATGE